MNPESENSLSVSIFLSDSPNNDSENSHSHKANNFTEKAESNFSTSLEDESKNQTKPKLLQPKNLNGSFCVINTSSSKKEIFSDRFIPIRGNRNASRVFEFSDDLITPLNKLDIFSEESRNKIKYNSLLENQLLGIKHSDFFSKFKTTEGKPPAPNTKYGLLKEKKAFDACQEERTSCSLSSRLFSFKSTVRENKLLEEVQINRFIQIEKEEENSLLETFKPYRKVPKSPYKILNSPHLAGDFYLELIHWSSRNQLAVSLGNAVWLWSGDNCGVSRFCFKKLAGPEYTAVQWNPKGNILATGDSDGIIELRDLMTSKMIYQCRNNVDRIDCISWNNSNVFSTGSRDASVLTYDLRVKCKPIMKYLGHSDEVCGLKWSPNGTMLASGGNDNKVFLWNIKKGAAETSIDSHKSAVKAITWSPHQQNLLLTGGGYTDKTIKIWNTLSMTMISEIFTQSQVCNLLFSKNSNEFLSTHGLNGNQIIVWKYPELAKVCVIDGPNTHSDRVLYLSDSPNGENVVTGSSDETLKFWNMFPPKGAKQNSNLLPLMKDLR